ncbi:MAG: hypothetical protein EU521_01570 [Promethearchaeota archaeon]|nr:MAG: hypothetical protein EU521_01570 [Candidatus Lokiarchaeota archaeon]
MFEKKKILLIGPPGAGKTTIKQIFFEKVNPIILLSDKLPPTRGIDSKVYTLYDYELGVFDLAGQENENWFSQERGVFSNSNLIICVFDINTYFKEIQYFFNKLIKLYEEIKLNNCTIVVFFHKVDLIEKLLLHRKIKAFDEFIKNEIAKRKMISIYPTSIAPDFFLETYDYIAKILSQFLSVKSLQENGTKFKAFRKSLEILTS